MVGKSKMLMLYPLALADPRTRESQQSGCDYASKVSIIFDSGEYNPRGRWQTEIIR